MDIRKNEIVTIEWLPPITFSSFVFSAFKSSENRNINATLLFIQRLSPGKGHSESTTEQQKMKTEHLMFNLELIRNVQCVLKMTRQLVKSNSSTAWSPAWKYKMRRASVLSRVLLPHLSTSDGDWPSAKEPSTAKGHKLLLPPHLYSITSFLWQLSVRREMSRVHMWHTRERKHVAGGSVSPRTAWSTR